MYKLIIIELLLLLFQFSSCTFYYDPNKNCQLYKNARFEWWGTDCGKFCHQLGKKVTCLWFQYHMGCFCRPGFYRNRNWDCVPPQGCDSERPGSQFPKRLPDVKIPKDCCPANEVWRRCGNVCENQCASLNNPMACAHTNCEKGCFCPSGMLRNYNGACIAKHNCKVYGSSGKWKFRYSKSISLSLWIKKWHHKHSRRGVCGPGVIVPLPGDGGSDGSGPDIPPNKSCKRNEAYTTCGDKCMEQCRNLYMSENCLLRCETGCFCKMGYFRNNRGDCVRAERCPGYEDRKWLTTTTRKPPRTTTTTAPPDVVRPTYTTTTTTTHKPQPNVSDTECPINEKWSQCDSHCKELCENAPRSGPVMVRAKVDNKKCSPNMNCQPGCFCIEGFFRNATDFCVPRSECPRPKPTPKPPIKCPLNEEFTKCGSKCGESCDVFNETLSANYTCPPTCDEGCFCRQGFFRDRWGLCIPQQQCECEILPQKCRDPLEEYTVCGKNCLPSCDNPSPICRENCARGCFCKEGYVYNENGVCTLAAQCGLDIRNGTKEGKQKVVKPSSRCPDEHERWSTCGNMCVDLCEPEYDAGNCPLSCETGCVCKKGYKRNKAEKCVPVDKCNAPPECGENEHYSECDTSCGTKCKDIGRNRQCDPTCEKGCFCKPGFFRDDNGKCIPRGKCVIDRTPECTTNEVYKNCSTRCGEGCEDLRQPVKCPTPEKECEKGCFCAKDYYRDDEGVCGTRVDCNLPEPPTEVPACEDNEYYKECGNRCEESCEDSIKCTKTCENGCFCIDDYLRNKKGKCVPSEKCKGVPQCAECKENEYYTECGSDCGRMCTDLAQHKKLVCNKDTPCHPGCVCKYGFYRTPEGECVTSSECQFFIDDEVLEEEQVMASRRGAKSFSFMNEYPDYDQQYNEYHPLDDESPGYSYNDNNYGNDMEPSYDDYSARSHQYDSGYRYSRTRDYDPLY